MTTTEKPKFSTWFVSVTDKLNPDGYRVLTREEVAALTAK